MKKTIRFDEQSEKQIDLLMRKKMKDGWGPGLALALTDGERTWHSCYGVKGLETEEPVTDESLFDLASLTKVIVTTTAVLRLVQDGNLCMDSRLSDYLAEYHGTATVYECLTHSTGYEAGKIDYRCMNREELMKAVLNHPVRENLKGTAVYSDVNFILLGFLLEALLPQGLAQYAREEICLPLGMRHAGYLPLDFENCVSYERTADGTYVRGRVHDGKAYRLGGVAGHAGLFADIRDIELFLSAYVQKSPLLFEARMFDLLKQRLTAGGREVRTYGWAVRSRKLDIPAAAGEHTLFHSGFTGNYLLIDTDHNLAIGILSNRIHPLRSNQQIIEELPDFYQAVYDILQGRNGI